MTRKKGKAFVGMSGGVDSSVAAGLLKKKGYEVVGIHLKCYNVDGCAERDAEDARRAAETLGIPFYVFNFEEEYKREVVDYMVEGYKKGITPNPDIICNKEIKFGLFFRRARKLGADFIATGHYVRKINRSGKYYLKTAEDQNKDQSYFLWTLTEDQIKHSLFPVGGYLKSEVRKLAREFNLLNADKKDSQGICFLGKITLREFLRDYIPPKLGAILNTAGEHVGEHPGAHYYTIGQRRGLNLGTRKKGRAPEPRYVATKNVKTNVIVVAEGSDNPLLYEKEIKLVDVYFTDKKKPKRPKKIFSRIRYRQPVSGAVLSDDKLIFFDKPQKFVAPGQSAVFYDKKGVLLGGGIIT